MSDQEDEVEQPEPSGYVLNRGKLPREELARYAGQWLAWNLDGTRILAHGSDLDTVIELLEAAGLGYRDVIWEEVPAASV
jgi:hypothetical protein